MMLLKDKVCIITGVSSLRGIGYATAALFAEHGARIVAVNLAMNDAIARDINEALSKQLGFQPEILIMPCDITNREDCSQVVSAAIDRFGRIDCLINCVGITESQRFLDITEDDFTNMISVNLQGAFNICQSVLAFIAKQGGGAIVNVASVAAQRGGGLVGGAHYAASKGGMMSLTRTIAREFGPQGVRANIVCPSMTETGMLDGNMSAERFEEIVQSIPLRRAGRAVDVAGACLFLASDLAAYINGATIDVNGGSHIH
jgi:NAD(P)-dependent dehydrogenase (short-subunit alcohol dehydrogenase family)